MHFRFSDDLGTKLALFFSALCIMIDQGLNRHLDGAHLQKDMWAAFINASSSSWKNER